MMKLQVNFGALYKILERLGSQPVDVDLKKRAPLDELDPISIELESGITISVDEIEDLAHESGLLVYKGHQVLLYIPDQGRDIDEVIRDPSQGRKFHVTDCSTLQDMKKKKRFDRYEVARNFSGVFSVSGISKVTGRYREADVPLNVCQNCLKKLNYNDCVAKKSAAKEARDFDLELFFSKYSTFFSKLPRRPRVSGGAKKHDYTSDWADVSSGYRESVDYHCEACGIDLSQHRNLLHVHHKDGVKSHNSRSNLIAVCADCHRRQPMHDHMLVSRQDMKIIERLRKEQIGTPQRWCDAFTLCDFAYHDLLKQLQRKQLPCPEIGHELQKSTGEVVVEIEIAWPSHRIGIVPDSSGREQARELGWTLWTVGEVQQQKAKDFVQFFSRARN